MFIGLFAKDGQPGLSAWRLVLVSIMQFTEGLSDRQAADAVRGRIDWKYALSLELEDSGFDFSVLSEFRSRLIEGQAEYSVFETMLNYLREKGLVKAGGRQRTDATHVLAAVRALNRGMCIGETLRAALNSLAEVAPDWLSQVTNLEWYKRYGHRIEESHFPKQKEQRQAFIEIFGEDGQRLLNAIYQQPELRWLKHLPAVRILRQVWLQQFEMIEGKLHFRADNNIPPAALMIASPYDTQATTARKHTTWWTGYKVHLTECCDEDSPRFITHVETSRAGNGDVDVTPRIHKALSDKHLLPAEHFTDTNYGESKQFVESRRDYGIDMITPTRADNRWQAKDNQGFAASYFEVNWDTQQATCPAGHISSSWSPAIDRNDNNVIKVKFSTKDCKPCRFRSRCTKLTRHTITLRPKAQSLALQAARARQKLPEFWRKYHIRAGIEGTISQAVRGFSIRRSRYRGLTKTHLQHLFIATAMNIMRFLAWLDGIPLAKTRTSHFLALASIHT